MKASYGKLLVLGFGITLMALTVSAEPGDGRETPARAEGRVWSAPRVNVEQLMDEDEANRNNKEIPWRVGFPMRTDLAPSNSGTWVDNTDGSRTWRLEVMSKTALWLVLGFSRFELQPGAELWLIDEAGRRVFGPKTSADIRPHGQLWFPPIDGSRVTVELRWPESLADVEPALRLGTVSHGYREWGNLEKANDPPASASGSCNNDVACPAGIGWEDEARSVVRLLSGGSAFCTGALINNTANDCTPYVLTAAHCTVNPASTSFQFNFQNVNCGAGPIQSTTQTLTGSTRVASYAASDFDLLRLDNAIPEAFDVFYSGWSRSSAAATRSTGIHHPQGDVKKISHNEDPLINGVSGSGYGNDHWRVTQWEDGTTEPSSSGSPLYNQNRHIVGQLHGGTASCSSITWDEYGKTSVSWIGGGSNATRLSNWLDPVGAGTTTLDGIDQSYCLDPVPDLRIADVTVDDTAGNGDGVADPGETLNIFVNLENTGNGPATAVAGTASTSSPLVIVDQGDLAWPAIDAGGSAMSGIPITLTIGPEFVCGNTIVMQLTATAAEGPGTWNFDFPVGTGVPNGVQDALVDNVESGEGNWTIFNLAGNNPWRQSTSQSLSPTTSWYVPAFAGVSDAVLILQEFTALPAASELTFSHLMYSEPSFDGGVIEYSTNGAAWIDAGSLITQGGYNVTISSDWGSPIAGRPAWSGNLSFWRNVKLDLSPLAGMNVRFRWRFATDSFAGSDSGIGWYVDDVVLRVSVFECSEPAVVPPGEVSAIGSAAALMVDKAPSGYFLSWSEPAGGSPVDEYRVYGQALGDSKRNIPVCIGSLGNVLSAVTDLPDDRRFMIVGANAAGEGPYGYDSEGNLRNVAADVCP